jgi:hypothetical protein
VLCLPSLHRPTSPIVPDHGAQHCHESGVISHLPLSPQHASPHSAIADTIKWAGAEIVPCAFPVLERSVNAIGSSIVRHFARPRGSRSENQQAAWNESQRQSSRTRGTRARQSRPIAPRSTSKELSPLLASFLRSLGSHVHKYIT